MKPAVKDMHPVLAERFALFREKMESSGLLFSLNCVLRTKEEQTAFFAQGRNSLHEVNILRKKAGMQPISEAENRYKVTQTMNSRHFASPKNGKSRAFDIVILRGDRSACWDIKWDGDKDLVPDYEEAAKIGESVGLVAGGHWQSFKDWPHFELPKDVV